MRIKKTGPEEYYQTKIGGVGIGLSWHWRSHRMFSLEAIVYTPWIRL